VLHAGLMLRRHLRVAHALDPAAYRTRWKLSADHALTAPGLLGAMVDNGKAVGLGRPRQEADIPPESTVEPTRRGRPRRPVAS
jgi:predicted transcriptional regulator